MASSDGALFIPAEHEVTKNEDCSRPLGGASQRSDINHSPLKDPPYKRIPLSQHEWSGKLSIQEAEN